MGVGAVQGQGHLHGRNTIFISVFVFASRFVSVSVFCICISLMGFGAVQGQGRVHGRNIGPALGFGFCRNFKAQLWETKFLPIMINSNPPTMCKIGGIWVEVLHLVIQKTEPLYYSKGFVLRKWAERRQNSGLLCHTPSQTKGQKAPRSDNTASQEYRHWCHTVDGEKMF